MSEKIWGRRLSNSTRKPVGTLLGYIDPKVNIEIMTLCLMSSPLDIEFVFCCFY